MLIFYLFIFIYNLIKYIIIEFYFLYNVYSSSESTISSISIPSSYSCEPSNFCPILKNFKIYIKIFILEFVIIDYKVNNKLSFITFLHCHHFIYFHMFW